MTNPTYIKEFLNAMYVDGFIQHDKLKNGTEAFVHVRGQEEVELAVQADGYVVIGRVYADNHGCDEEIELLATADADEALQRFETAVDYLTSVR